jgi:CAAX protease family protein
METSTHAAQIGRHISLRTAVPAYVAAIVTAEALVAFASALAGVLVDGLVVFALLNHYLLERDRIESRESAESMRSLDVLLALSLVPILRICSLTMTVSKVPVLERYAVVGIPVLAAAGWVAHLGDRERLIALFGGASWRLQVAIGLSGIPLGLLAFAVLRPGRLESSDSPIRFIVGCLILIVFSGLLEEVVFRGLLQEGFCALYGSAGKFWSSALFAAVYFGARPIGYLPVATSFGIAFGAVVARTRSLVGVIIAHGLMSIGLVLVWPQLLG